MRLVSCQTEHDEVCVSTVETVVCVGVMVWSASLPTNVIHHLERGRKNEERRREKGREEEKGGERRGEGRREKRRKERGRGLGGGGTQ